MCYGVLHSTNEGLSLPPPSEYLHLPPPVEEDDVFVPGLPQLIEDVVPVDVVPSVHHKPLFVEEWVAVYVFRGRAFRDSAPPPPLLPLGHSAGGVLPAQGLTPGAGSGLAVHTTALLRIVRTIGRSRN